MQITTAPGLPRQSVVANLIAALTLPHGATLAILATRISGRYARRWLPTLEETSLTGRFLTDRLFLPSPYGILAVCDKNGARHATKGGRGDDRSEA